MNAAFQIIHGGVIPLDIATVQTGDGGKCYMSLLANWGLVADVDIESEKFRKIGETRFILGMKSWPDAYLYMTLYISYYYSGIAKNKSTQVVRCTSYPHTIIVM